MECYSESRFHIIIIIIIIIALFGRAKVDEAADFD